MDMTYIFLFFFFFCFSLTYFTFLFPCARPLRTPISTPRLCITKEGKEKDQNYYFILFVQMFNFYLISYNIPMHPKSPSPRTDFPRYPFNMKNHFLRRYAHTHI
ncbi:hypothetical protein F5X96DRAFT_645032, partial [Biscogniauxia mediterranea]